MREVYHFYTTRVCYLKLRKTGIPKQIPMINFLLRQCFIVSCLCLFFFLFTGIATAKNISTITIPSNSLLGSDQTFDPLSANKSLNQIEFAIKAETTPIKQLQRDLSLLTNYQITAKKCIDTNSTQLYKLTQRLAEISSLTGNLAEQKGDSLTEEQKYLNNHKNQLNVQLSECRLLVLRAEDLNARITKKLRELMTLHFLYAYPNLFETFIDLPTAIGNTIKNFNLPIFQQESGIDFFIEQNKWLYTLPFFIIFSLLFSKYQVKKKILILLQQHHEADYFTQMKQSFLYALNYHLSPFLLAIFIALFFSIFTHSLKTPSYFALINYAFLAYLTFAFLVRFYFFLPDTTENLNSPRTLITRFIQLGTTCFTLNVVYLLFSHQLIDPALMHLFKVIIITMLCIHFIAITLTIKKTANKTYSFLGTFFHYSLLILFPSILLADYLGYHSLAFYFLYSVILTIFSVCLLRLLNQSIQTSLNYASGEDQPWQKSLRRNLGLKRHEKFLELLWLRGLIHLILGIIFVLSLSKIWGLTQSNFDILLNHLLYGIEIGKLQIIPLRILGAILLFISLSLLTRYCRACIFKNAHWDLEASSRESLGSIIGYLGFSTAFILAALLAGVNFSGLAIIAGALSVGIGFGLQSTANNFISGLILLIERPIKLGDRVIVGQTEGYVKKISIRCTHIITTQLSDVIVPNSELISQQVTNYMFYDMTYKVFTAVGVAYGSDTELVRNILLGIARKNPYVITNNQELEPMVYFKSFGESSLNFELYCAIKDVNLKVFVISELNFAIEKAFREKNIEIAFPQREIRIKP